MRCQYLYGRLWDSLVICPGMKRLGRRVILPLIFETVLSDWFPQWMFHSECIHLHPHQQLIQVSFFLVIFSPTFAARFVDDSHSNSDEGYLQVLLICFSLMARDIKHSLKTGHLCFSFWKWSIKLICYSFLDTILFFENPVCLYNTYWLYHFTVHSLWFLLVPSLLHPPSSISYFYFCY